MGDEWEHNPASEQPYEDDLDKRIEEIRRIGNRRHQRSANAHQAGGR